MAGIVNALMDNAALAQSLTTGALKSTIVFDGGGAGANDVNTTDGEVVSTSGDYTEKYNAMSEADKAALNAAVAAGGEGIYIKTESGGWQNTSNMTAAMATGIDAWMADNVTQVMTTAVESSKKVATQIQRASQS